MATAATLPRRTVKIASHGELLDAWVYEARDAASSKTPVIVMAHGLGAVKAMRLDAYCEAFSKAGYVAIAFDYRCFGESTGVPRGLVDVERQLQDYEAVIEYARALENVDEERVGLFGTSFSGGHVIRLAAKHGARIKATVSQTPFTDGLASARTSGIWNAPWMMLLGLRDVLFGTDGDPVRIQVAGEHGQLALLNGPDAINGQRNLLPPGVTKLEVEAIPARLVLTLPFTRPGAYASQVKTPILFALCAKDTCTPADASLAYARTAPNGVIKWYDDVGHFDIYLGKAFERSVAEYLHFYAAHL